MIDEIPISSIDDDDDNLSESAEISKSQRKRDADAVRELGSKLSELGASELATIPLPSDVLDALKELNRLRANGAKKRQLGFLAKKMRHIDVEPVELALEKIRQTARANTKSHHLIEQWRDRLLGDHGDESTKDALTAFFTDYPSADRQHFRHLQRQAITERTKAKPPAAARQLFKSIKEVVLPSQSQE